MNSDSASQSPARPSGAPRFAADRMLGRLARWLRLAGADVSFDPQLGGGDLLRQARLQGRIVLTRDKRLRTAPDAIWLESNEVRGQMRETLAQVPIDLDAMAFTRCSRCNTPLRPVSRQIVARRVPPFVYASQERFAQCDGCGRVYWDATHPARILRALRGFGLRESLA